ncbi:MAG: zinc finger-like domain-containing protein [Candidatus Aenigmarchaeota archaeon]|nr:zinc finger-like domain-containing protein [Candidatus Aenigmarchaeota archaeon]
MTKEIQCGNCDGFGKDSKEQDCPVCKGRGVVDIEQKNIKVDLIKFRDDMRYFLGMLEHELENLKPSEPDDRKIEKRMKTLEAAIGHVNNAIAVLNKYDSEETP